jgi:hypothetical protein
MKISINGKEADISLEAEKNVGDILAAMEQWLDNSGHRLSGMAIDGETIHTGSLEESFARALDSKDTLDIRTSPLTVLLAEALLKTRRDLEEYGNASFDAKPLIAEQWKASPQGLLLFELAADIYEWTLRSLSGEGLSPQSLCGLLDERVRELGDPLGELNKADPLVAEISARLEDLPLDIQTGKDARAVESVQIFSNIAEKMFRIFNVLKAEGFPVGEITVEDRPVSDYIAEFGAALKELLAAYEQRDAVLVGDLAEYELAPRLRSLYTAIKEVPAA